MTGIGAEQALRDLNVSRETMSRLAEFVALLIKWNVAINLVSKTTIDQIWPRHVMDSGQVFDFGRLARHWVDLGSGGGFPGLVVAILALEKAPEMRVTLVESDQRKAAFLRQASQVLGLGTQILSDRIEAIPTLAADVISARALAPLSQLCGFAQHHLAANGKAIFLKGKSAAAEIAEAQKQWCFSLESHISITDQSAVVLILGDIKHV